MRNKGFKEFIKLLNSRNVAYLVVGGYALAAHGHPRNLARSLGLIADPTTDITADVAAPRVSISEATHGSQ